MQRNQTGKSSLVFVLYRTRQPSEWMGALCVEKERSTNLVVGLVELLGIERGSNSQLNTGSEENVVCNGSYTTVVDLGLQIVSKSINPSILRFDEPWRMRGCLFCT